MTFTLHVDGARWRGHTERTRDAVRAAISAGPHTPTEGDLVPVAKGNGYGFGNVRCVREAQRLGLTRVAVGTVYEVAEVAAVAAGVVAGFASAFEYAAPRAAFSFAVSVSSGPTVMSWPRVPAITYSTHSPMLSSGRVNCVGSLISARTRYVPSVAVICGEAARMVAVMDVIRRAARSGAQETVFQGEPQ